MFPGSARASRAGDRALAVANFLAFAVLKLEGTHFGEGAEMCTRGACAPRKIRARTQRGLSILFDRRGDTDLSWRVELPGRFALSLGDVTRF